MSIVFRYTRRDGDELHAKVEQLRRAWAHEIGMPDKMPFSPVWVTHMALNAGLDLLLAERERLAKLKEEL